MKRISQIAVCVLLFTTLAACGMSKQDVANNVQQSMQQTLDTDSGLKDYDLKVDRIDLIKKDSHSYKGIAAVSYKGEAHDVSIDVTVDNDNLVWEAPPGSFMFVARDKLQNLFQ